MTRNTGSHIQIEIEQLLQKIAGLEAQIRAAMPVPHVLIYSSQVNTSAVGPLIQQLRLRGLRVRESHEESSVTAEVVKAAGTILFYLTPESVNDAELKADIRALLAEYKRVPTSPIFIILDDITPEEAQQAGIPIKELNILVRVLTGDEAARSTARAQLAGQVLNKTLLPYFERLGSDYMIDVDLIAHPKGVVGERAALTIDWKELFIPEAPPEPIWRTTLIPALNDLCSVLKQARMSSLRLHWPDARLSAACAFGYVFSKTARFQIEIARESQVWYRTDTPITGASPLTIDYPKVATDPAGTDITIEISITQSITKVSADVERYLKKAHIPIYKRIRLDLPTKVNIEGAQAMAITRQIIDEIAEARAEVIQAHPDTPSITTHFFAAIPAGLAVLIGWSLNACGNIQCYELIGQDHYERSCLLQ